MTARTGSTGFPSLDRRARQRVIAMAYSNFQLAHLLHFSQGMPTPVMFGLDVRDALGYELACDLEQPSKVDAFATGCLDRERGGCARPGPFVLYGTADFSAAAEPIQRLFPNLRRMFSVPPTPKEFIGVIVAFGGADAIRGPSLVEG